MNLMRLRELVEGRLPIAYIARDLGVSRPTVYKYIRSEGLHYRRHDDLHEDDISAKVTQIAERYPEHGAVMVQGQLAHEGYRVKRHSIRRALREADPEASARRKSHTVKRRIYSVPCPHYLWHIDGNGKLVRWKMMVHGSIDGSTRLITFLSVSDNNRSDTVMAQFQMAIREFQRPLRIRTDKGGENILVWDDMLQARGNRSVLVGSSVHNQRIEREWRDINLKVSKKYREIFYGLEEEERLNPDNPVDILCLHWVFLPLIQSDLSDYAGAHNQHSVSTEGGLTPIQLWVTQRHLTDIMEDEFQPHPAEHEQEDLQFFLHPDQIERPLRQQPCRVDEQFSIALKQRLRHIGRPTSAVQGRNKYIQVVNCVGEFLLEAGHL